MADYSFVKGSTGNVVEIWIRGGRLNHGQTINFTGIFTTF